MTTPDEAAFLRDPGERPLAIQQEIIVIFIKRVTVVVSVVVISVISLGSVFPLRESESLAFNAAPLAGDDKPKQEGKQGGLGADQKRTVEVLASLNVLHACPGDKVRLVETVPRSRKCSVFCHWHHVHVVADYDKESDQFVSREPRFYRIRTVDKDFKDLPDSACVPASVAGQSWPYDILTPREQGYEFEIQPLHLGIFQITAGWTLRGEDDIESQPVILIVRPPQGRTGKANRQGRVVDQIAGTIEPRTGHGRPSSRRRFRAVAANPSRALSRGSRVGGDTVGTLWHP